MNQHVILGQSTAHNDKDAECVGYEPALYWNAIDRRSFRSVSIFDSEGQITHTYKTDETVTQLNNRYGREWHVPFSS